jgi:hypothetical protein
MSEQELSEIDFGFCEKCKRDLSRLVQCQYCGRCLDCCTCADNPLECF